MRNISLRDLKLADSLAHLNEVEMIHPSNDALVNSVLESIGFNTKQGVQYVASLHRDMQGKAAVGFQAIGEYNVDPKYRGFIDTIDRVIVAGLTDISLAKDMAELMGKRYNYKNQDEEDVKKNKKPNDPRYYSDSELLEMGYTSGDEEDEYEETEPDCELITSQINALNEIKIAVRGE